MPEARPRNVVKLINCHALSSMSYEKSSKENFFARKYAIKQDRKITSKKLNQRSSQTTFPSV